MTCNVVFSLASQESYYPVPLEVCFVVSFIIKITNEYQQLVVSLHCVMVKLHKLTRSISFTYIHFNYIFAYLYSIYIFICVCVCVVPKGYVVVKCNLEG